MNLHSPKPKILATTYFQTVQKDYMVSSNCEQTICTKRWFVILILTTACMPQRMLIGFHLQIFLSKMAEAFMLLLFLAWVLTTTCDVYNCMLPSVYQQAAAHNVVVDKLNGIEGSLCEIRDNLKWFNFFFLK